MTGVVYRSLPDSYEPSQFRVIPVRSRADVHNIAAKRRTKEQDIPLARPEDSSNAQHGHKGS